MIGCLDPGMVIEYAIEYAIKFVVGFVVGAGIAWVSFVVILWWEDR